MSKLVKFMYGYQGHGLTSKEVYALPERLSSLTYEQVASRLYKGWPAARAISTPAKRSKIYPYKGQMLTNAELHALPECVEDITLAQTAARLLSGWSAKRTITTPVKASGLVKPMAPVAPEAIPLNRKGAALKTHTYKGRQLTRRQLKALPECLPEVTEKHISVRMALGWIAEKAITTHLRKEAAVVAKMKVHTARARERKRVQAIMAVPTRPETTSAFYTLGALEARKQLDKTRS